MSQRTWPPGTSDLVLELDHVRQVGVHAFKGFGPTDRLRPLTKLREIGGRLPLKAPAQAPLFEFLKELLGVAITSLEFEEDCNAAEELFALDEELGIKLKTRQENAAASYRRTVVTYHVFRIDYEKPLLRRLAETVESLTPEDVRGPHPYKLPTERQYIERPELEAEFHKHVINHRLIAFCGDAGTGKSSLARRVGCALVANASKIVEIAANNEDSLITDVANALDERGEPTAAHDAVLKQRFKKLLGGPKAPQVVIIDNVEERQVIEQLVPTKTPCRSLVIVTSRHDLLAGWQGVPISVGNMTSTEAQAMAQSRPPWLAEDDADRLAKELDNRPLAIEHACGYLAEEDDLTVDAFCELLRESVSRLLDKIVDDEPTLTAIYRMTVDRLDANSLRMLDLITSSGTSVPRDYLETLWHGTSLLVPQKHALSVKQVEAEAALRTLRKRSLIGEGNRDSDSGPDTLRSVRMHALTQRIMSELRAGERQAVYDNILKLVSIPRETEHWEAGKVRTLRFARQAPNFRFVLAAMVEQGTSAKQFPDIGMLAALALRSEIERGVPPDRDLLRLIIRAWYGCQPERQPFSARDRHIVRLERELSHYWQLFLRAKSSFTYTQSGEEVRPHDFNELGRARALIANEWKPAQLDEHGSLPLRPADFERELRGARRKKKSQRAARLYFGTGTVYFDLCDFRRAYDAYRQAYERWALLGPEMNYSGEMCRAGFRVVECCRRLGAYTHAEQWRAAVLKMVRDHVQEHGFDEWTFDPLVTVALFRAVFDLGRGTGLAPATFGGNEDLRDFYRTFLPELQDALDASRATVVGPTLQYYRLVNDALLGVRSPYDVRDDFKSLRHDMAELQWPFGALRCSMSILKLEMALCDRRSGHRVPTDAFGQFMELADRFEREYSAPYWSADALLAAYVLRLRYGYGDASPEADPDVFIPRVFNAVNDVGRLDKLRLAQRARTENSIPKVLLMD